MKELEVFLKSHLTEANVYFKSHTIECDVIIYNIPRREVVAIKDALALYLRQHVDSNVLCECFLKGTDSSITIKAHMRDSATKMIVVSSATSIPQAVSESAIKLISIDGAAAMEQSVSASIARYRLFSDMDDDNLSAFDDMSLDDVDFIIAG